MKKLMMFAAAMTIAGGAYAAPCGEVPTAACALVYDVKISLKTTKAGLGGTVTVPCGEDLSGLCYRTPSSVSLKGFLSACDCDCISFQDADFYLWDSKGEEMLVEAGLINWDILNLIGKKGTDVETFWTFGDPLATEIEALMYAAGFGTWDSKADRLKSASGNIVAKLPPPQCEGDVVCVDASAVPCSDLDTENQTAYTVGSGTWSIKYNSSASKKSADTGVLPFPSWY